MPTELAANGVARLLGRWILVVIGVPIRGGRAYLGLFVCTGQFLPLLAPSLGCDGITLQKPATALFAQACKTGVVEGTDVCSLLQGTLPLLGAIQLPQIQVAAKAAACRLNLLKAVGGGDHQTLRRIDKTHLAFNQGECLIRVMFALGYPFYPQHARIIPADIQRVSAAQPLHLVGHSLIADG